MLMAGKEHFKKKTFQVLWQFKRFNQSVPKVWFIIQQYRKDPT